MNEIERHEIMRNLQCALQRQIEMQLHEALTAAQRAAVALLDLEYLTQDERRRASQVKDQVARSLKKANDPTAALPIVL